MIQSDVGIVFNSVPSFSHIGHRFSRYFPQFFYSFPYLFRTVFQYKKPRGFPVWKPRLSKPCLSIFCQRSFILFMFVQMCSIVFPQVFHIIHVLPRLSIIFHRFPKVFHSIHVVPRLKHIFSTVFPKVFHTIHVL